MIEALACAIGKFNTTNERLVSARGDGWQGVVPVEMMTKIEAVRIER